MSVAAEWGGLLVEHGAGSAENGGYGTGLMWGAHFDVKEVSRYVLTRVRHNAGYMMSD